MSTPLWMNAEPRPTFMEGGAMQRVTDEQRQADAAAAEAAQTPRPESPIDPTAPAWRAERMQCRITGHIFLGKFVRNPPLTAGIGEILSRRRDEKITAWLQTNVPQKYLRLREQLDAVSEENRKATLREARARLAFNKAIQTTDAKEEAAEWEQARAAVQDSAVRLSSIQEAATVAYATAHDSYRQLASQIKQDGFAAGCQTYSEALAELSAAISGYLDKVHEAAAFRDRSQSFALKRVEEVLPNPTLPTVNLDPPVPDSPFVAHQPERKTPEPATL